jgi:branched-chain amino acid aminotransferase
MSAGAIWIDGDLVPVADARISPLDNGFTVGDGVFESCTVVDGRPFALRRHLARLRRSAEVVGLEVPLSDEQLRAAALEVVAAGPARPAPEGAPLRLRITVTSGVGPGGSARGDAGPTVVVFCLPIAPRDEHAAVATVPWTRNERSAVVGAKTTSYAENAVALAEAVRRGAQEAVLANTQGDLCEGTGANVFVAVDGHLRTPPLSSGCLAGVTRELVLELVDVEVAPLPLLLLADADEAFLTSTTRGVQPIARVDDVVLAACPGPRTAEAAAALAALVAHDLDP